jgi:subtilisin-like proprotein convertase family protein
LNGKRGRRQGSSTMSEADDTTKSGALAKEVEGGDWRLEVEDDQGKLGRWPKCAVRPN